MTFGMAGLFDVLVRSHVAEKGNGGIKRSNVEKRDGLGEAT